MVKSVNDERVDVRRVCTERLAFAQMGVLGRQVWVRVSQLIWICCRPNLQRHNYAHQAETGERHEGGHHPIGGTERPRYSVGQ